MECLRVLGINEPIPTGFKLATFSDIVDENLLDTVLKEKWRWIICRLQDGEVSGRQYGYTISQKKREGGYGHKLLCMTMHSGEKVLKLTEEGVEAPEGYQLAKVEDIVRLRMLQEALKADEWYICELKDGFVMGKKYGYQAQLGTHKKGYGHKLTVGPTEIADGLKSLLEMSKERPKLIESLRKMAIELRSEKYKSDVSDAVTSGTAVLGYVLMGVSAIAEVLSEGTATPAAAPLYVIGEGLTVGGNTAALVSDIVNGIKESSELKDAQGVVNRDHELSNRLHKLFSTVKFQSLIQTVFRETDYVLKTELEQRFVKLFKTSEQLPILTVKVLERAVGAGVSIREMVGSLISLNNGSPSDAADALDREASQIEKALKDVNDQIRKLRKLLLQELKDCLKNLQQNWVKRAVMIIDNPLVNNYNPMWGIQNENGMSSATFVHRVLQPVFDDLGPKIETAKKRKPPGETIDLALIAHGSIGRPLDPYAEEFGLLQVTLPTQYYYLTDSLQSITFYQPWGCMLHSNAAYRILTKTIDRNNVNYFEGKENFSPVPTLLGDTFMEQAPIPNKFNKIPHGNALIPTVWFHPTPREDPVLQDLEKKLRQFPAERMLYFWMELPQPIPACVATNAISLIASMLHTEIKIHMVCCLGPGNINNQNDLLALQSITQYCNLVGRLYNSDGSRNDTQIWMATGDTHHP